MEVGPELVDERLTLLRRRAEEAFAEWHRAVGALREMEWFKDWLAKAGSSGETKDGSGNG